MTLLEVETYLARAATARLSLEGLIDVLSDAHLPLAATGDDWDVQVHLAHLATADGPTADLLGRLGTAPSVPLEAEGAAPFLDARARAIQAAAHLPLPELREQMARGRREAEAAVARLTAAQLEAVVELPGRDAWGRASVLSVRRYLTAWAAHDSEHEQAIRRAIVSAPSPAALAAASRLQRPARR